MNNGYVKPTHPPVHKMQYNAREVWDFENGWNTTLCSCQPRKRCCYACFCCCCMGCTTAKYLGESQFAGCCPCTVCYFRTKLRVSRRIPGSCCGDCMAGCFALACTRTQMANELEGQGLWTPEKEVVHKGPSHPMPMPPQHNDRFKPRTNHN